MREDILVGVVLLVCAGSVGQWLAWRLRIPSILVLLLIGFVGGPILGVFHPDELLGPLIFPLVSMGAALVLFEGGLSASWEDIRRVASPVGRLVTLGLLGTWTGVTLAARHLLLLPWNVSVLLGAVLVVTGPTVIGPLLRLARPGTRVGHVLKFEGIVNDPMGAVLAVITFQVIEAKSLELSVISVMSSVAKAAVLSSGLGLLGGWLFAFARERDWIPGFLSNAVLVPAVLGVYAVANTLQHESGLVAVTVMGVYLASQKRVSVEPNIEFTEHARTMLISVLFIVLTARMRLHNFEGLGWGGVGFVVVLLLVVRPLSVYFSMLGTELNWRERALVAGLAPRGIVAAAVSSVFGLRLVEEGFESARFLMPATFLVIASGVVVYGLGAAPLTRVLGLRAEHPTGILIVGANHVARVLAEALSSAGLHVVLVDSSRSEIRKADELGLQTVHGRLLSNHVLDRVDMQRMGHLLALTPSDEANTLAATHFRRILGEDHVHQLVPSGTDGLPQTDFAEELNGRFIAAGRTFEGLLSDVHRGAQCEVRTLSDDSSFSKLQEGSGGRMLPLFALDRKERLRVLFDDATSLESGERIVSLVRALPAG